jgi:hypothetical protein
MPYLASTKREGSKKIINLPLPGTTASPLDCVCAFAVKGGGVRDINNRYKSCTKEILLARATTIALQE